MAIRAGSTGGRRVVATIAMALRVLLEVGEVTMLSITPCRERISERCPLASFVVTVPPDRHFFEVACATDPRLFAAEHREHRTSANFATSRLAGLLRTSAGQATYMVPPDQLRRFAGARRLFYALAAYRGPQGQDPLFTLSHDQLDQVPSIQIAPDFTGRSLDRGRLVRDRAEQRYGGATPAPISWGGDAVASPARVGAVAPAAVPMTTYDDGFDAALWRQDPEDSKRDGDRSDDDDDLGDDADRAEARADRIDDDRYGARRSGSDRGGRPAAAETAREPEGFEDGAELLRRLGGLPARSARPAPQRAAGAAKPARASTAGAATRPAPTARAATTPARAPTPAAPARTSGAAPATWRSAPTPARAPQPPPPPSRSSRPPAPGHAARLGGAAARANAFAPPGFAPASEIDDGYEDAPDLARHLGPALLGAARVRFGESRRPAITHGLGKFPGYADEEPGEVELPEERPSEAAAPAAFDPEDPRQRLRILHRITPLEGGAKTYSATRADLEYEDPDLPEFYHRRHVGLSWGFIQFAQRFGSLGQVLAACNRRDPDAFRTTFGEHNAADPEADPASLPAGHLLRVTNAPTEDARLDPVTPPEGGEAAVLWDPVWIAVFDDAGKVPAFREAQREVADRRYYEPYLDFLTWIGFDSVRAHAMFVDRSIHMGGGAAMQWIVSVVGPIRSQADRADALARLGVEDVRAFQLSPPPGFPGSLTADGVFGPRTHAAMMWAPRELGDPELRMPTLDEMLAALCDDAARRAKGAKIWRLISDRLRELKNDPGLDRLPPEPNHDETVEEPTEP